MSTTVTERPGGAVSEAAVLRQLTAIQARRYAMHPLFLAPLALLVVIAVATANDPPDSYFTLSDHVASAFLIGVFGLVVAYRLTRSEDEAIALLPSAPTAGTTRTLALLGACLVPAGAMAVLLLARLVLWIPYPPPPDLVPTVGGWAPVLVWQVSGYVVAAFGGPALGVAVGRWMRYPGAGILVAVLLMLVCTFASGISLSIPGWGERWVFRAIGSAMPWQDWVLVDQVEGEAPTLVGVRPGSMLGQFFYSLSLCGLAAWAAIMKDAQGAVRRRWVRLGWAFGVLAVVSFFWTLLG